MADYTRTVQLIFGGKDNVTPTVKAITQSLDQFETQVGNLSAPLAKTTDAILAVDAAIIALGATMVGVAINQAGKFQQSFNEITTLFEASPEAITAFSDEIQRYASNSTQSLEDINASIYSAISAGVDFTNSVEALTVAEKLAVAGNAELNESLVVLVSSLNAYGASTDEAENFADALFQTVKLGQTTLPELGARLAQVTNTAAGAGVGFDELLAAIAALTATGLPTAQAITSIKAAISNVLKPTAQAEEAAQSLGLEFNATALKTKGLYGFLENVRESTGGNTETMAQLFGSVEALGGVISLTGIGFDKFTNSLAEMENKTGSVEAAFEKMVNSFGFVGQKLVNNIRLVFVESGSRLLEQFTDDVDALTEVFARLGVSLNQGAFDPVFDALNAFGADVEATLRTIAQNLPDALQQVDFEGIIDAFSELGLSIGELFDFVDLKTPEGLADAIQRIVDIGESLIRITADIISSFEPLVNQLVKGVDSFNDLDASTKAAIGTVLGFGKQVDVLLPLLGTFLDIIGAIATLVGVTLVAKMATGVTAVGIFSGAISGLIALLFKNPAGLALTSAAALAGGAIAKLFESFGDDVKVNESREELEKHRDTLNQWRQDAGFVQDETGNWVRSLDKLTESLEFTREELYGITDATKTYEDQVEEARLKGLGLTGVQATQLEFWKQQGYALDPVTGSLEKLNEQQQLIGESAKGAAEETKKWVEIAPGIYELNPKFLETGSTFKKVKEEVEDATKKSDEFQIKMEEIASNERIKTIEAAVELNIAKLEADAKVAEAILQSLSTSIQSTGDLLGGLFTNLLDAEGLDRQAIKRQILEEQKLREQAFELQKEYVEAQIRLLNERADSLANGDSLISIQADGLEPELEAFMWKILERVQVKASQEQALFLLGMPQVA